MADKTAYDDDNIFARILRGELPAHVIHEDDATFAFMDIMPMSEGHTLVIPREPAVTFFDLSESTAQALIGTTHKVAHAVRAAFQPHGVILAQLSGAPAGQTVFHIHFHIVPRWEGVEMNMHARKMARPETLKAHAERIRAHLP